MQCLIQITVEHIANGKPKLPRHCPVALAIQKYLNKDSLVCVGPFDLLIYGYSLGMQIQKTPKEIKEFMLLFDAGKKVEPFEFELDIDESYL